MCVTYFQLSRRTESVFLEETILYLTYTAYISTDVSRMNSRFSTKATILIILTPQFVISVILIPNNPTKTKVSLYRKIFSETFYLYQQYRPVFSNTINISKISHPHRTEAFSRDEGGFCYSKNNLIEIQTGILYVLLNYS